MYTTLFLFNILFIIYKYIYKIFKKFLKKIDAQNANLICFCN